MRRVGRRVRMLSVRIAVPVRRAAAPRDNCAVTALISHTTFDATDAYAQSVFWSQVLGFAHDPENPDAPGDEEFARLLELGATVVHDLRRPDGPGWVVLADPEGNEFCILRSDTERTAGPH